MGFFRDGGNSVPVVSKVLSRELVAMACRTKTFFLFVLFGGWNNTCRVVEFNDIFAVSYGFTVFFEGALSGAGGGVSW